MKPPGYDHEIRTIHGWEDYLSWQEEHITLQGEQVICKFTTEYSIPLARCKTPTEVLIEAFKLTSYLKVNEPAARPEVIAERFIQLVRKPMRLPHNLADMFKELSESLVIEPRKDAEHE